MNREEELLMAAEIAYINIKRLGGEELKKLLPILGKALAAYPLEIDIVIHGSVSESGETEIYPKGSSFYSQHADSSHAQANEKL